jgi:DHA1 family inner membrane transport protein
MGGFSIGTGEFVIMGLLPEVARDVGVSIPVAGHFISAYALGVVIGAPVLAVLTARWPRRRLLIALMSLYALGNLASTLVPGEWLIGLMRFASGSHTAPTSASQPSWPLASCRPISERERSASFYLA